ncbi:MAG TPA: T9SS type A sorting domain-containing protein [Ignavibacteriaceae bacterium]|nr:T9SS type A sorting domain-containing protein [Ignavibacteriaceae bacterium]
MIKFFTTLLFFVPFIFPQTQWYWQNPKPDGGYFTKVDFVNESTGWILKSNGIIKTTDGGTSWFNQIDSFFSNDINFINEKIGYFRSNINGIWKTEDGGNNWININPEPYSTLFYLNEDIVFAGGRNLISTTDGGLSWGTLFDSSKYTIKKVWCNDINNIIILTYYIVYTSYDYYTYYQIFKTSNGGIDWEQVEGAYPSLVTLNDIYFVDEKTGFIAAHETEYGGPGGIQKTTDGGNTWFHLLNGAYYKIFFIKKYEGYAIDGSGYYWKTIDNGETWERYSDTYKLVSFSFVNEQLGFNVFNWSIRKTTNGGEDWIDLSNWIDMGRVMDVDFFDENIGIAVGDSGILRTTNKGIKWEKVFDCNFLEDICIIDNKNSFVIDLYTTILKTTDAGLTWKRMANPLTYMLGNSVSFSDLNNGIITATDDFGFLKTTDGGNTWNIYPALKDSHWFPISVHLIDSLNGIIVGEDYKLIRAPKGIILKTTDGGNTWYQTYKISSESVFYEVDFADKNYGVAIGMDRTYYGKVYLLSTSNGGSTWTKIEMSNHSVYELSYPNKDNCFILLDDGIIKSTDQGATWNYVSQNNYEFNGIHFLNSETGYLVGNNSKIVSTVSTLAPVITDVVNLNNSQQYFLYQNYPNPFNPTTKVNYIVPKTSKVKIDVYDILGNLVKNIINEDKSEGKYEVEIDLSAFSSGVYLYRIQTDNYTESKKMMLIK